MAEYDPLIIYELPYLDPDILHDVLRIKAVFMEIEFLDMGTQEFSIVPKDFAEFFFLLFVWRFHEFFGTHLVLDRVLY